MIDEVQNRKSWKKLCPEKGQENEEYTGKKVPQRVEGCRQENDGQLTSINGLAGPFAAENWLVGKPASRC